MLSTDHSFILVSICMEENGPVDIINKLELRIIICLYWISVAVLYFVEN